MSLTEGVVMLLDRPLMALGNVSGGGGDKTGKIRMEGDLSMLCYVLPWRWWKTGRSS